MEWGNLRDRITGALAAAGGDLVDIRLERVESSTVAWRGPRLETASKSLEIGGIVRVLRGGRWGTSSFNSLDDLEARVREAAECARAAPEGDVEVAPSPVVVDEVPAAIARDFREVSPEEKKELVSAYSSLMLSQPDIKDSRASLSDRFSTVCYASSEGSWIVQERPYAVLSVDAVAAGGGEFERAGRSLACGYDIDLAWGQEELALEAAARARKLLTAPSVKGGVYTLVAGPYLGGLFVHEAFGHLSESDLIADNDRARDMMTLGRRFGEDFLSIVDDGSVPGLRGSLRYDDEGVPTAETYLIRDGILVGRLHSRETAARMDEKPTGNARATFYRHPPIVRMTNTCIKPGTTPVRDLFAGIDTGVYAVLGGAGQTMLENFSFAAGEAYMIRNGEVCELVRDVNFGGNLFTTLANIEALGDDFTWTPGGGGCGKGQGMMLPVGMGSPHLRIRDVLMGGTRGGDGI